MRITLVIPSMNNGGAQRVMSNIANYWAMHGNDVSLVTLDSIKNDFYSLDKCINRVGLNLYGDSVTKYQSIKNNLVRLARLREEIKKSRPDVIISFLDRMNVMTLVASIGMSIPVIVSEHTDPRQSPPGGIWSPLRVWVYKWASAVVVLTNELRDVLSEFVPQSRVHVIPNAALPVKKNTIATSLPDISSPYIIAMGRLVSLKGFDVLLTAFSKINDNNWSLVILGDGPEYENLDLLAKKLGIENSVHLPGNIQNPSDLLFGAEMFVLSSRYEGFPMALIEAMSCGLPVISFDCPTGPNEIIRNGVDGILVAPGDVESLADAMKRLMKDESGRVKLASRAPEVLERFSVDKIMSLWKMLFTSIVH